MKTLLAFLALFLIGTNTFASVEVSGVVIGADKKPCVLSHVHFGKPYADLAERTTKECSKDGKFSITLPGAGNYMFYASGVNHEEIAIPLFIREDGKPIKIAIQLKANLIDEVVSEPTIIGDWNKFSFSKKVPMSVSDDRTKFTYEFIADADSVAYQLLDVVGGHSMNGSLSDNYVYDGGGDYRSVVNTKKGEKVVITFDPEKIRHAKTGKPVVKFEGNEFLQKAYDIKSTADAMNQAALIPPKDGGPVGMTDAKHTEIVKYLYDKMQAAGRMRQKEIAEYTGVLLADSYHPQFWFEKQIAENIFKTVPPESPFWGMAPGSMDAVAGLIDSVTAQKYMADALANNPERNVKANLLCGKLIALTNNRQSDEARKVYNQLKADYSDIREIKYYMTEYNPDAVIMVGKPLPDFDVKEMGSDNRITKASMMGKYYLVDMWGSWCGPCIRELPGLTTAFEKYQGRKGFTVLSMALDPSEEVVKKFRDKRFKMPWMHTVLTGLFKDPVAEKFEVMGVPKPILVGPDGMIVATEPDLRGEQLEKTLEKFLGSL
jgi:thiol-disulfide isomerase/thioredoxin